MKTTIYYFSGTGNSLAIARELSEYIPDSKLFPMVGTNNMICHTEKVGFVFPLYYWGTPDIVERVIKKMDLSKAEYIFYIITSGGLSSPHNINGFFNKILKKKNKKINSSFRIVMPGNYITKFEPDPEELVKKKIQQSKIILKSISKKIIENKQDITRDRYPFRAGIVNTIWKMNVGKSDRYFYINDKCNSCNTCQNVCPVNNIAMKGGKPIWNNKCQECMACIQFCPMNAILSGKTSGRTRYHHTDITVKDIIDQKNYQ